MKRNFTFVFYATLLLLLASCTRQDTIPPPTAAVATKSAITGEVFLNPSVSITAGQSLPITLLLSQATGNTTGEITVTCQMKNGGSGTFAAALPDWFNKASDFVAGTIDYGGSEYYFTYTGITNESVKGAMYPLKGARSASIDVSADEIKTRVFVNDSNFLYDWSKISNEQLKLIFRNVNPGKNEPEYVTNQTNMNIKKEGTATFTFNFPPWFIHGEDMIAGAIDVDVPTGSNVSPSQFKVIGPTDKISFINNDPVDYIYPMYFPFTKTDATTGKLFSSFKSFGSMFYFKINNNLLSSYVVYNVTLSSDALDFSGTMDFAGKGENEDPAWIATPNSHTWTMTNKESNGTEIPSLSTAKGRYVWGKQANGVLAPFKVSINEPPVPVKGNNYFYNVNPFSIVRPAAAAPLEDNGFYSFSIGVNADLMLSEIYINGQSNNIWIEVYNNGTTPALLSNYYLVRATPTGQVVSYYSFKTPSLDPGKILCVGYADASLTNNMIATNALYEKSAPYDPTLLLKDYKGDGDHILYLTKSAPTLEFAMDPYKPATNSEHLTRYSYIKLPQPTWIADQWFKDAFQFETLGMHTITTK